MSEAHPVVDFHHPPTSSDPDGIFAVLSAQTDLYLTDQADQQLVARAYARAAELHHGIVRDSGDPYVTHPLHVALILSYLQLDAATLAAALLHDVLEDTSATQDDLQRDFGAEVADLVEGVTKLTQVSRLSRDGQSAANIRKVFVAMSEDVRVMFIKLADRLHNLRTINSRNSSDSRERTATEALEVYTRIADRLGIAILRKEMEDIAFSYLDSSMYERVKSSIEARYRDNADRIERIERETLRLLFEHGIRTVEKGVEPNPRRAYDMFRRSQGQLNPPDGTAKRVPPQLRFHVLVQDVHSCYMAMAAIHSRWPSIASEIRDYISAPLPNGYQSLHTTVFVDEQPIKFQIRTMEMHRTAQFGITAYMKEGEWPTASPELKRTVDDLRRFGVEAVQEMIDPVEFLTTLKAEALGDEIYVYTPKNKVIKLPLGATPVDFAYQIHTDVGHRCRGALVDGHWVPLNCSLHTGERVEILTVDDAGPCFDWLIPDLKYTRSPLAKGKIRRWFRRRPEEEKIDLGRQQLYRIVERLSLKVDDLTDLIKRTSHQSEEELFVDIGGCDLAIERILPELLRVYGESQFSLDSETGAPSVPITGTGGLGTSFALCCHPLPGDDIVGYILAAHSTVEVHRSDCGAFLSKVIEDRTPFVEVKWGQARETHLACMEIYSLDRPFLLRDVWTVISEEEINISDVDVQVDKAKDVTTTICIDIEDWLQFNRILVRIEDLPGMIKVRRTTSTPVRDDHRIENA